MRYLRRKAGQQTPSGKPLSQDAAAKVIGVSRRGWQFWEQEGDGESRPAPVPDIIAFATLCGFYPSGEAWEDWLGRMELECQSQAAAG